MAAPETISGLAAMREVAILSAHAAIERYQWRQVGQLVRGKLLIAAAALFFGGLLLWMHWSLGGTRDWLSTRPWSASWCRCCETSST